MVTWKLRLCSRMFFMPAGDWSLLRQVECSTADLAGLAWSPSRDWCAGIFSLSRNLQYGTFSRFIRVLTIRRRPVFKIFLQIAFDFLYKLIGILNIVCPFAFVISLLSHNFFPFSLPVSSCKLIWSFLFVTRYLLYLALYTTVFLIPCIFSDQWN